MPSLTGVNTRKGMDIGTAAEVDAAAASSEYSVSTNESFVLRIKQHSLYGEFRKCRPNCSTDSSSNSSSSSSDEQQLDTHPWQELLKQPLAPAPSVLGVPDASAQAIGRGERVVGLPLQRTAASTSASNATTRATLEDAAGDQAVSDQLPTAMSDIQAPTNDSADDILTQGVLEGLDDLYDFGDSHCKEISVCTDRGSASAMAASADAKGGSEVLDQLDDMGAAEAEEIIQNFGGFGRAPMSVGMPAKSEDQMRKDAELADMDDQEAQKIINSLGGFAKPGLALTSSRSHGPKHGQCIAAKDELNGTELSDMADAEAQRFIRKFGGFSKAAMDAASQCSADDIAMNPTPPPPKPASHEAPQLVHTPCSHKDAAANDGASATDAHTRVSLFPSRSQVLSARKALKMESRNLGPAVRSPLKTPLRKLASRTPRSRPQFSLHPLPKEETPATTPRRLSFKSPGIKRPNSKLHFSSPSKRVAVDDASGRLGVDAIANQKAMPSLIQFSQTFRPPASTRNSDPTGKGTSGTAHQRRRNPPRLPPVTSKVSRRAPGSTSGCPPPPRMFDLDHKQSRYSLLSIAKEMDKGIDSSLPYDVLTMTASKAAEYCFPLAGSGQGWGFSAARQALLARGCMPGVATEDWVKNHFRWCVWSCASYARRFPARCQEFWTTKSIISRLLYRYEREFVRGERSTLKKVLEADASPQQLMVLCIATISWQDKKTVVEVTDGWYGISALVDPVLEHAIARGRLRVGDKIACCGLRMSGIPEGASPLSAKAKCASLILHANCVRRAHWYAKLGFEPASAMFLSLSAVHEHGGPIGAALDVVIVRSYPMLYMETLADGRRIVRSEKEECRVQHAFESAQAAKMQEIAEQMMTPKKQPRYSNSIGPNSDAKDLYSFVMDRTMDSGDVGQQLTPAQIERLDQYAAEKRSEDESAVLERLRTENPLRQVQPLFKLLVCDYPSHQYKSPERNRGKQALVTVWGPRNVCPSDFVEGSRFILTGLSVSASKNGSGRYPVCLNFNAASSRSKPMPADPSVIDQCDYYGRATLWVDELRHIQTGQEIDVQGIVDEYVSDDSSQMSLLRLKGEDESSTVYHASIEFSAVTFGKFNIGPGDQLTVCNCRYMHYDPLSHTFIVKAGDIAKFLVS